MRTPIGNIHIHAEERTTIDRSRFEAIVAVLSYHWKISPVTIIRGLATEGWLHIGKTPAPGGPTSPRLYAVVAPTDGAKVISVDIMDQRSFMFRLVAGNTEREVSFAESEHHYRNDRDKTLYIEHLLETYAKTHGKPLSDALERFPQLFNPSLCRWCASDHAMNGLCEACRNHMRARYQEAPAG